MVGLLRRKHKKRAVEEEEERRQQEQQQQQQRQQLQAATTTTPLYAKFGTTEEETGDVSSPSGEYAHLWDMIVGNVDKASDAAPRAPSRKRSGSASPSRKANSPSYLSAGASSRPIPSRPQPQSQPLPQALPAMAPPQTLPSKPLIFAAMAAVDNWPPSPPPARPHTQPQPQPQPHRRIPSRPPSAPGPSPARAPKPVEKALPSPPPSVSPGADSLGVPLDDDPFAKAEGVKLLVRPPSVPASRPPSCVPVTSKPPSPVSSEDYIHPDLPIHAPPVIPALEGAPDRLSPFLSDPALLRTLLGFFSFYEWCLILSLSRDIRFIVVQNPELREVVLERFLRTVGYKRWSAGLDPLSLSLQDLSDYMRGVSTPTHEYARIAALYNHSLYVHPSHRDPALYETVRHLAASCRAYTRVVLRLRAQAEREARARARSASRPPSRAPSPTFSYSNQSHASSVPPAPRRPQTPFQSPLFKPRRAPLLRVFVPSPDGDWLSDKSVLECEAECRRAGVLGLIRLGDVVWDVAVGDEGNVGRLVWDGSYLIDLDYTYSPIGDLPKYMPTLAFPPSYFHRVIRSAAGSNPVAHIDLRPWGDEIAANLQLLQDRVRTETPQGAYHNVVRWVHRSSFIIRPPPPARGSHQPHQHQHHQPHPQTQARSPPSAYPSHPPARVPIPESGLFVDPGWYGTIVVETEGTNEALKDLQERCGPGVFPPRPAPVVGGGGGVGGSGSAGKAGKATDREGRLVFRILREKSRPGEIWIRAVSCKERLL